jgi:hypothetical protein
MAQRLAVAVFRRVATVHVGLLRTQPVPAGLSLGVSEA